MIAANAAGGGPRLDLVAIGDPVLDVVVHASQLPAWDDKQLGRAARLFAGGTEANAACAASRLGLRTALFGTLGDGPDADFLHQELLRFGVVDAHLRRVPGAASAMAVILVSDPGERAIVYTPAPRGEDRLAELQALLARTRCVYTVPYDIPAFERLAAAAHQVGTQVVVDIERAVAAPPDAMPALCRHSDLMFFNEAGFRCATGEAPTPERAAALIARTLAHTLVVTLGAQGALAVDRRGNAAVQRAYGTAVVDTTGAGDSFNGAFLAAHLRGHDLSTSLAQGCAAASLCVATLGARPGLPDAAQVAEVLRRGGPVLSKGPSGSVL